MHRSIYIEHFKRSVKIMESSPAIISSKKTWERRLDDAKKRHRPKLKNWSKDGFHSSLNRGYDFDKISATSSDNSIRDVYSPVDSFFNLVSKDANAGWNSLKTIDRFSCKNITPNKFIELYEKPCYPCIIRDIPQTENWNAVQRWTLENICNESFTNDRDATKSIGERYFKVG